MGWLSYHVNRIQRILTQCTWNLLLKSRDSLLNNDRLLVFTFMLEVIHYSVVGYFVFFIGTEI